MDDKQNDKLKEGARTPNDAQEAKPIEYSLKKAEHSISRISAKIADASDISEEISQLSEEQEEKLEKAQQDLEELYTALDIEEQDEEDGVGIGE